MANSFVLTSCHEKHQSTRFFDKHFLLEKLTKLKDPLVKLSNHIDWKIFIPILDASIIEASLLCNTREENKQIKQGQTPESWQKQPNKLRQKDRDARWAKKNNMNFYTATGTISRSIKEHGLSTAMWSVMQQRMILRDSTLIGKDYAGQKFYGGSA